MDKNDLKSMWRDANYTKSVSNFSVEILEQTMALRHSRAISKSLLDVKLKVLLYTLIFIIYIGLMIFALVLLRLKLSINSLIPLALVGVFLLITTTSEIVRLSVLTKTADNFSIKDSLLVFCKKLKRIMMTDFIIYIGFFYLSATYIIFNYLTDIGGVRNLTFENEIIPAPLLAVLILIHLSLPWFIKYQNNQRYKKLFSNLKESVHQLDDQSETINC